MDKEKERILEDYLAQVYKTPNFSKEEKVELCHRLEQGDATVIPDLTDALIRVVVDSVYDCKGTSEERWDYLCIGNEALVKALKEYDFEQDDILTEWVRRPIYNAVLDAVEAKEAALKATPDYRKKQREERLLFLKKLHRITEQEGEILEYCFGLGGEEKHTYAETLEKFDITTKELMRLADKMHGNRCACCFRRRNLKDFLD